MDNDLQQTSKTQSDNSEIHIMDIVRLGLANWYWFALSLTLCIGFALYVIRKTPETYYRSATVLIKDDNRAGQLAGESSVFQDLSILNPVRSIDNELLMFKSERLMYKVVKRLNLDISYQSRGKLRSVELYDRTPVRLIFPDASETISFSLSARPISDKEVVLSDFSVGDLDDLSHESLTVQLNDTIYTPVGRVVVEPTAYFRGAKELPIWVTKRNLESVASRYSSKLQTGLASKTSTIITLALQDVSIKRAEDVINTLIDAYNEDAITDKSRTTKNTADFLDERIDVLSHELSGVDSEIAQYKQSNQLTDIVSDSRVYLQSSTTYQQEVLNLKNQQAQALFIKNYLSDAINGAKPIPVNTGLSDMNIGTLINDYNEQLIKRDKFLGNSSANNPVVLDMNNSLLAIKQAIISSVDNLISSIELRLKNVSGQESSNRSRISAVPGQQKFVLSIERQMKVKEALYLYLLNKREENALSQALKENAVRVVDNAKGSNIPVAPNPRRILFVAIFIALLIPSGAIYAINFLDTRVHSRKDLLTKTTIPFLGDIPNRKPTKTDASKLVVVSNENNDAISEAFRIIRTNISFMKVNGHQPKVIIMTSLNPNAGKTFVSSNLAVTFAMTGQKVVLVDLDIRKGTLSSRLHKKSEGVTNFLIGAVDSVDSIIQPSGYNDNLDVISCGSIPPNPTELLMSNRIDTLVDELKRRYDYVFIDNVPSNMIADAVIVNRVADLTIYVVRAGVMDKRQLTEVESLYRGHKFNNMATVLNGVDHKRLRYGYYGYTGDYGKYGYYGYGNEKSERK